MPDKKKIKLKKRKLKVKGAKKIPQTDDTKIEEEEEKTEGRKSKAKDKLRQVKKQKESVKIHFTALNKILRHGFRFSHPKGERKQWVECMGFLVGDVSEGEVEIKEAIPMAHGNLVEVEFSDEHYSKADEINQTLTDNSWIVGWYHTHPGHGLFLSPVDKVNHAGYQSLNPDAVALVFDPSQYNGKNEFEKYIKVFKLVDPNMREKSDFKEIEGVDVVHSLSEVMNSLYEMSLLNGKDGHLILEYGEKMEESELKVKPSIYLDAEDVEKDIREMRNLIKHLHKEVKVLHVNLQKHLAAVPRTQRKGDEGASSEEEKAPVKCEFCGNTSVTSDDKVCGHCGKSL
jgi:proteasome lid subunit RPN8/RPN11